MSHRKLYLGPVTDNRRWDKFAARPDDVYVVTPPAPGWNMGTQADRINSR